MSKRIIVLPEELEVIEMRLIRIEKVLKNKQQYIEDPIMDTEGVMTILKVSRRSIQNWRDQGLLVYSAVNGKFYYRLSAVNKMLDNHIQKMED